MRGNEGGWETLGTREAHTLHTTKGFWDSLHLSPLEFPRESKRTPVGKLDKGRSSIPESGIPSDWSILANFVNTVSSVADADEKCDMAAARDLSTNDVQHLNLW